MSKSNRNTLKMAYSFNDNHEELKLAGKKAEHFVEMNKIRIHYTEVALSIIGINCHITGSRSEGVHLQDSDTDILTYGNDIEAVQSGAKVTDHDKLQVEVDTNGMNPGYAMLKVNVNDLGKNIELLHFHKQPMQILCNNVDGSYFVSTRKTINAMSIYAALTLPWTGGTLTFEETSGPAKHVTVEMGNKKSDLDVLYTILCKNDSKYTEQWQQRSRHWPPEAIVKTIMKLPVFLVPLGHPLSAEKIRDSQWKFSFNLQERTLMRSLTGTQIVCCNLFKSLKHYLKHFQDTKETLGAITLYLKSYYFKTCFLWTLEQIRVCDWTEQKIVENTIRCVQYLLHCLKEKQCPHYFIPENNLFEGKDIVSLDSSNLEKFLISICDENHNLWAELLSKVLFVFNKPYMQKQPVLNCASTCRHLIVLSVTENKQDKALQRVIDIYEIINSLDKQTELFDSDWTNSILLTLQSVIATLQCIRQMKVNSVQQGKDTSEQTGNSTANRNMEMQDRTNFQTLCEPPRLLSSNRFKEQPIETKATENKKYSSASKTDLDRFGSNWLQGKESEKTICDKKSPKTWEHLLSEASAVDFCSGKLKEATVHYWLKDFKNTNKITKAVIARNAVNFIHFTGFTHVRDETFKDEENRKKEWSSLVKENVYFDVLFIPAEIQVCPPAIQLELCEGRGLMVNPTVYAYYLRFCVMQKDGTTKKDMIQLLDEWQTLLDEKQMAGYNYIDYELISYSYLEMRNFDKSFQNLQKGFKFRDTGSAHYWLMGLLVYHILKLEVV